MNQKTINEIKDRAVKSAKQTLCTDILRLANMQTRKRGNQVYAVCYNCGKSGNLKTDKFSVNTVENLYHCFGCGLVVEHQSFIHRYSIQAIWACFIQLIKIKI